METHSATHRELQPARRRIRRLHSRKPLSPHLNVVYSQVTGTVHHIGYARYFTPPPLELAPSTTVTKFDHAKNASASTADSPVRSDRSHYFDVHETQSSPQPGPLVSTATKNPSETSSTTASLDRRSCFPCSTFAPKKSTAPSSRPTARKAASSHTPISTSAGLWAKTPPVAIFSSTSPNSPTFRRTTFTSTTTSTLPLRPTHSTDRQQPPLHRRPFRRRSANSFANTGQLPSFTTVKLGIDQKISLNGEQE